MNKSLIHNTDRVLNEVTHRQNCCFTSVRGNQAAIGFSLAAQQVSLSLREEVMDYLHGDIVRNIPLFQVVIHRGERR
jgi:hypothetical protein